MFDMLWKKKVLWGGGGRSLVAQNAEIWGQPTHPSLYPPLGGGVCPLGNSLVASHGKKKRNVSHTNTPCHASVQP